MDETAGPAKRRQPSTKLVVLVALLMLAGVAVGIVLLLGSNADAVGGCGGG